jgi:phosphoribosylanthranilate isomerase
MTRVVISGITSEQEALMADDLGANALSFLVTPHDEPRPGFVNLSLVQKVIPQLSTYTSSVYVTPIEELFHLGDKTKGLDHHLIASGINHLQLHGAVSYAKTQEVRKRLPRHMRLLRAIQVTGPESLDEALEFSEITDGVVLDRVDRTSGQVSLPDDQAYWKVCRMIVEQCSKPVTLSGSLTPSTVTEAVDTVGPHAVDVNKGVNGDDGLKDPAKVEIFIRSARGFLSG